MGLYIEEISGRMKEIVMVSGKGGTGKTSLTASFAFLGGTDVIVADCDVDAADMHLLMQPDFGKPDEFFSGEVATIDTGTCTQCGTCYDVCRFNAIAIMDGMYRVDPMACEGCGYCARVCPEGAISDTIQKAGEWYISTIKTGSTMVHARLGIAADNSGKLVAKVKNEARRIAMEKGTGYMLVDGSPGIGCPVISSLTGADFAVIVTEPTVSGSHDLERIYNLIRHFNIPAGCIINKSDLNEGMYNRIRDYLKEEGILHLASLPYDETFTDAMVNGLIIMEYSDNGLNAVIKDCWNKIKQAL